MPKNESESAAPSRAESAEPRERIKELAAKCGIGPIVESDVDLLILIWEAAQSAITLSLPKRADHFWPEYWKTQPPGNPAGKEAETWRWRMCHFAQAYAASETARLRQRIADLELELKNARQ